MSTENETTPTTPATPASPAATTSTPAPTTPSTTEPPKPLVGETTPPSGETPPAWAEYVPDPNKTDAENAAAKADHDATKPAEVKPEPPKVEPLTVDAIKLPEGFEIDEPVMNEFLGILNDGNLSQSERAQKLVDLQIEAFKQASERNSSAWNEMQTKWQEEVKTDPEVGGANLTRSLAEANRVVDQLGTAELKAVLSTSGLGNNVHVVRFLTKIAPFVSEAAPVSGNAPGKGSRYTKENLYPDQK